MDRAAEGFSERHQFSMKVLRKTGSLRSFRLQDADAYQVTERIVWRFTQASYELFRAIFRYWSKCQPAGAVSHNTMAQSKARKSS